MLQLLHYAAVIVSAAEFVNVSQPSNVQSIFIVTTNDYYKQLYGQQSVRSTATKSANAQLPQLLQYISRFLFYCVCRGPHSTKSNNNTQSNYTRDYLK
uniref:Uncharacterized protein n=1 Tax=Glossina palpalis gambiensis TaxID=67801 RepID=A0A1B0BR86_9MUSC